jgi:tmRNA-binding protein
LWYIKRARRLLVHLEELALIFSDNERGHAALVALKESVIIAQFVLAISYVSLARHGHSEGKRKAILTIAELVSITRTLKQDDMDAINAFPLVCAISRKI